MTHIDLFAGVGGFSLGFQRAGIKTIAMCERDPHCRAVLRRHWPKVTIFDDVRTMPALRCDILTGGFPCQPFSSAARGRNNAPDLWPAMLGVVERCRPPWVVGENVPGLGAIGIDRICDDLESAGYAATALDLDVALPERQRQRARLIFLAYADREGEPRRAEHEEVARVCSLSEHERRDDSESMGVDARIPGRMDRLRMLGNSFPPGAAEAIGRMILDNRIPTGSQQDH